MTHYVELFYSQHCVGCPEARQVVRQLAAERPDVAVAEFDVAIHLGAANRVPRRGSEKGGYVASRPR